VNPFRHLVPVCLTAALTHAQPLPPTHQPHAATATAFLALPQVAPEQGVLRPGGVPPGAPAGTLVGFRLGTGPVGFGSLAVDKAAGRVVWFQAVPPTPPVPLAVCARPVPGHGARSCNRTFRLLILPHGHLAVFDCRTSPQAWLS
jgi:hypothetical protein